MKVDEAKIRIKSFLSKIIDLYLPCNNLINKLENATAKLYIEQHISTLNKILNIFADENGMIDESVVLRSYEDALFKDNGELHINLKELLQDKLGNNVVAFLPDKIILLKKEDLYNIFCD